MEQHKYTYRLPVRKSIVQIVFGLALLIYAFLGPHNNHLKSFLLDNPFGMLFFTLIIIGMSILLLNLFRKTTLELTNGNIVLPNLIIPIQPKTIALTEINKLVTFEKRINLIARFIFMERYLSLLAIHHSNQVTMIRLDHFDPDHMAQKFMTKLTKATSLNPVEVDSIGELKK
ncbi:MAG: hypothetical protein ACE365_07710 [Gammaproteobacteria bacterium]